MSNSPLQQLHGRQLILFRHAKSDWNSGAGSDYQRPLAKKGSKAAKRMGKLLSKMQQTPDYILASSALRAQQTLQIAASKGHWDTPIDSADDLYEADPSSVLAIIQQMPDDHQRIMLVGHEPCWSRLASRLIGGGKICIPTAAMVRIDFEVDSWKKVADGSGELIWLLPPKLIKKAC